MSASCLFRTKKIWLLSKISFIVCDDAISLYFRCGPQLLQSCTNVFTVGNNIGSPVWLLVSGERDIISILRISSVKWDIPSDTSHWGEFSQWLDSLLGETALESSLGHVPSRCRLELTHVRCVELSHTLYGQLTWLLEGFQLSSTTLGRLSSSGGVLIEGGPRLWTG